MPLRSRWSWLRLGLWRMALFNDRRYLEDRVERDVTTEDLFMLLGIIVGALALYISYNPGLV